MTDDRNLIIAIVLSLGVLLVTGPAPAAPGKASALSRDAALAQSSRVSIANSIVLGSINLRGRRIDDLCLVNFSPRVVLLSPSGSPQAYFAEREPR